MHLAGSCTLIILQYILLIYFLKASRYILGGLYSDRLLGGLNCEFCETTKHYKICETPLGAWKRAWTLSLGGLMQQKTPETHSGCYWGGITVYLDIALELHCHNYIQ